MGRYAVAHIEELQIENIHLILYAFLLHSHQPYHHYQYQDQHYRHSYRHLRIGFLYDGVLVLYGNVVMQLSGIRLESCHDFG